MSNKLQPNLLLQQQIKGRYLPTSLNHRGETALTFSAVDQQNQRPIILKYYQRHDAVDIQDKIQRGVMLHAQLRSDYIIPMIDFGVHGQYQGVWCVLSREEAPNLTRFVKSRGGLDSQTTCELLINLCDALQSLHEEGKVHGNLKPSNVFVKSRSNQSYQTLISDILGAGLCGVHKHPSGRVTYNDPSFFTYEQASGKEINSQTDIAGLGLLAYFMLKNALPFEGRTTDKILTAVIIGSGRVQVRADEFSGQAAQRERLAQIVNECLAKQPSSRPKNLASLKSALLEIQSLGQAPKPATAMSNSSGLEAINSLGNLQAPLLGTASLTPNHSLMNPLGFGQTLGFDAITDQALDQFNTTHQVGEVNTPSQTSYTHQPTSRPTGAQRTIITAPPEGFSPEDPDTLNGKELEFPSEDQTIFSSPSISSSSPQTMMGGLSNEDLQRLQGLEILTEPTPNVSHRQSAPESTYLGGVGGPGNHTLLGANSLEDTRPISPSELQNLGLKVSAQKSDQLEDWGDLSEWTGLNDELPMLDVAASPETLTERHFAHVNVDGPDIDDLNVDDLGVDELELDLLLEQAASALETEQAHPAEEDTQRSITDNSLDDTVRIDLAQAIKEMNVHQEQRSLSDRFEDSVSHQETFQFDEEQTQKIVIPSHNGPVSSLQKEQVMAVPELFSTPAVNIAPERATIDKPIDELFTSEALSDMGHDDFSVMNPKLSGTFAIPKEDRNALEVTKAKPAPHNMGREKLADRELDTQLEFQRPEELFPNIPEWQSLIELQAEPMKLSRALLSIPLPLSGQLLPFSQFQLEIEGREHEEGFFVKLDLPTPHIPVILDNDDEVASNEFSGMWAPEQSVSRDPKGSESSARLNTSNSPLTKGEKRGLSTVANLSLLVIALLLTGTGLILGSGMSVEEAFSLISGESYTVPKQPKIILSPQPRISESALDRRSPAQSKALSSDLSPELNGERPPQIEIESSKASEPSKSEAISPKGSAADDTSKAQKTKRRNEEKLKSRAKKSRARKSRAKKSRAKKSRIEKRKPRRKKSAIKDPFAM